MTDAAAAALNSTIAQGHPAAARCLSPLGRRLFFPLGVVAQAAEAAGCPLNATIGQLTDGHGRALTLPALSRHIVGLSDEEVFLYAAQGGRHELRRAWLARLAAATPADGLTLPAVTGGLTHGLSTVADLFVDEDTDVLLPAPRWGNYDHIFGTRRGGRLHTYPVLRADPWTLDTAGLAQALQQRAGHKTLLVINFPGNPVGYTPTVAEAEALIAVLCAAPGPLVVVCDDAYHGMLWEDGLADDLFARLAAQADPERLLPVKIDGVSKELFFFGGRVGFVTFAVADRPAAAALEEKVRAILRSTVSSVSAPGQALALSALRDDSLEDQRDAIRAILRRRYRALKDTLLEEGAPHWPFNSAFFALLQAGPRAEALRQELLAEGVGVVAFPREGALRVSYSTLPEEDLPRLARLLAQKLRG